MISILINYFELNVKWIVNITDIGHLNAMNEDKILCESKNLNRSLDYIINNYLNIFLKDFNNFNIIFPQKFVRASSTLKYQLYLIKKIIDNGFAYINKDGIYLDVSKVINSKKMINKLLNKNCLLNDNGDFALWRFSKEINSVDSEFGKGIPGWHIECLAIIEKYLSKEYIDIHIGGYDHIFIHHNNEIIQKLAIDNNILSKVWLHTGFINDQNTKMSKSKLNEIYLSDIVFREIYPDALKIFFLTSNYFYNDINFCWNSLVFCNQIFLKIINIFIKGILNFDLMDYIFSNKSFDFLLKERYSKFELDNFIKNMLSNNLFNKNLILNLFILLENSVIEKFITGVWILNKLFSIDFVFYFKDNFDPIIFNFICQRIQYRIEKKWDKSDEVKQILQDKFNLNVIDFSDGRFIVFRNTKYFE